MSIQQMFLGAGGGGVKKVDLDGLIKLYTGNTNAGRSIDTGIDLSTAGTEGMVWIKNRDYGEHHFLFDTVNGAGYYMNSDNNDWNGYSTNFLTAFNDDGFTVGGHNEVNGNYDYVAYSFPSAPGFFDCVKYSGSNIGNSTGQTLSHNLGEVPGMMIIKSITIDNTHWTVWHKDMSPNSYHCFMNLNETGSPEQATTRWNDTDPTDSTFTVGSSSAVNGGTTDRFMAYLFADNDVNVKCGYYQGNETSQTIETGFKPQWIMIRPEQSGSWIIIDKERGMTKYLNANSNGVESDASAGQISFVSNGFYLNSSGWINANARHLYVAIAE